MNSCLFYLLLTICYCYIQRKVLQTNWVNVIIMHLVRKGSMMYIIYGFKVVYLYDVTLLCLFERNPSKEEVINHYDAHDNNGGNEDEDMESFEDEEEDSFEEFDANLKSKPAAAVTKGRVHSPYMGSSSKPPVSPVNFRDSQYVAKRQRLEEDDDEDEFVVSESSRWDSGRYIIF